MVSRRKILSQSRDELSYEPAPTEEPEDDVWFTKEKLYKVNIVQCFGLFLITTKYQIYLNNYYVFKILFIFNVIMIF